MDSELTEPILMIGLGGAGSKLAVKTHKFLQADCLLVSHDKNDFNSDCDAIQVNTKPIVNPSMQVIRGFANSALDEIKGKITDYSTIVIVANLAGKAGSAIAPLVSQICKDEQKNVISFAIMPFKFENDRIFNSGTSLKRLRDNSNCTIIFDNDALLESNPDLTINACYEISNLAIMKIANSLRTSSIPNDISIVSTSKESDDIETSLKESIKMLYEDVSPNVVKRSMLYVLGGNNVPIGMLNSVTKIASGVFNENNKVDMTASGSENSKVVMLSSIQGKTRFDNYDPLGIIPSENTLDWAQPDCSISCELDIHQLE
jgi:cell division protein FtsZ